ncbi:DeoR/GlpR family DNA-binding transcription regulator [Streptomyces buecherae]|uniref:DeoR/GlpR transcriptional regulator n=1 Tax=Streptomyces buecherae TaxID=2763006 RepID=A0A7H8N9E9_9ACTN|nr:DeoR/GlpR family DNA-binding transcription regulator [Streptomyces buecherae]MBC3984969.1 DeoR/GlpR transcriptional regulator [Streptomyces buecherae]MBC3990102.1 DeoR/GlpR transcriptional regulator [Streptomyces buecherae]QKW51094.1 DeoR/GlpR transcriptional regulator [Streptomyces buecherae]QNJ41288.1 DeoR/GlpR transcriptional regulator [Streptomyces buecherae]
MNRYERHNMLLGLLAERRQLEVDSVAAELDVSAATIRRDLDHLAEQRLLTRTRGGAVAHTVAYDLPLRYKAMRHGEEKERIGRAAAGLVSRGMVVGLNGGTTTTEVARAIATRTDGPDKADEPVVTIVTNALNIANELAVRPHVKIVATGGVAMPQSYELIGPLAGHILREISLDIAFIGVGALHPELGASAHDEGEASINALLAGQARKLVVVADSSKLGEQAFARICAVSAIDVLVTDSNAPEQAKRFEERGVTVIQA